MTTTSPQPPAQPSDWNQAAGNAWVELQGLMDGLYQPLADLASTSGP